MQNRKSLAIRYCLVAWASLLRWLLLLAAVALLVVMLFTKNDSLLLAAGILVVVMLVAVFVCFVEQPGVRCLMCGANLLSKLSCVPHGNAKTLFGSPSLRATVKLARLPALMDCPYCDGHFRMACRKGDEKYRQREHLSDSGRSRAAKGEDGLPVSVRTSRRTKH